MAERKGLTKKQRFEIFKRDGFTCQYCGRRPPEVVLVVDHINPVANGGDNDPLNLTTSCYECNAGKGKTQLADVRPLPDASNEAMVLQQEIAEMALYSQLKAQRTEWVNTIVKQIQEHWSFQIGGEWVPEDRIIVRWLDWATPELIERAINLTASINETKHYNFAYKTGDAIRYCSGVMRNAIEEGKA